MSKEMAVSLPLVIFLWNFCDRWRETEGSWLQRLIQATKRALIKDKWLYALLAVASVGFAAYAIFFQRASGRTSGSGVEYWGGSLFATLLTVDPGARLVPEAANLSDPDCSVLRSV